MASSNGEPDDATFLSAIGPPIVPGPIGVVSTIGQGIILRGAKL
jgi:hypothetical protein